MGAYVTRKNICCQHPSYLWATIYFHHSFRAFYYKTYFQTNSYHTHNLLCFSTNYL